MNTYQSLIEACKVGSESAASEVETLLCERDLQIYSLENQVREHAREIAFYLKEIDKMRDALYP